MTARNPLEGMGQWLKEQGDPPAGADEAERVALALFLYMKGLSTRQVARVLQQLGVKVSHGAVWNWVHKCAQRVDPKALGLPQLPPTLIVDDTALQLGSRQIWLFLATDPGRRAIVFAEPYAGRSQWEVEDSCRRFVGSMEGGPVGGGDRSRPLVPDGLGGVTVMFQPKQEPTGRLESGTYLLSE